MMKKVILIFLLAAMLPSLPASAQKVTGRLVAENTTVQPGTPFWVGVQLKMKPHWHIYWRNPGDSGLATTIDWELPEGFSAGPIQWPRPISFEFEGLINYGYEDQVTLLVQIAPPAELQAPGEVDLKANAAWLACESICIPEDATLSLRLPVARKAPVPDPERQPDFSAARQLLPAPGEDWENSFTDEGTTLVVKIQPPEDTGEISSSGFFPHSMELIQYDATQHWEAVGDHYNLILAKSAYAVELPERIEGVLVYETEGKTYSVQLRAGMNQSAPPASAVAAAESGTGKILLQIAFAFVGGLILNLMPCVFPVISIKILGFVKQAEDDPAQVRRHGWLFTAGVLVSFWILAGVLIALRAGGAQIGWGFQLQSPGFIILLASVFFLFGLNLLGVFEIGTSLTGTGAELTSRHDAAGTFFSGFLATVVATPCTAPLMGSALFFALTQPPWVALTIFSALGLGMATPYLILSHNTRLLNYIPRPGPWMETMKQAMGFLLIATVVWLAGVLGRLAGTSGLMALLFGALLMAIGGWVLGRWGALHRTTRTRRIAQLLALLFIAAGIGHALYHAKPLDEASPAAAAKSGHIQWETFSPEKLAELRSQGQRVFLDFTADWCLTCKVNEKVAFTPAVARKLKELNVVPLKADWTRRDPVIAEALAGYGRTGVPLYVLYNADPKAEPILLPSLINAGTVLAALEELD